MHCLDDVYHLDEAVPQQNRYSRLIQIVRRRDAVENFVNVPHVQLALGLLINCSAVQLCCGSVNKIFVRLVNGFNYLLLVGEIVYGSDEMVERRCE